MTTRRAGFTLVELLTLFLILGTLAGIGMPRLRRAVYEADAARVVADVRTFRLAVAQYHEDTGALPPSTGWGQMPGPLADYLPAGFSFEYKAVEYAWTAPSADASADAGEHGATEPAGSRVSGGRGRGEGRASAVLSALRNWFQGLGWGRGSSGPGRGSGGQGGPGQGGAGSAGGAGAGGAGAGAAGAGSAGSTATEVSADDVGLWVRYPADSEIARALRSHDGTRAHWAPSQMLFVIER